MNSIQKALKVFLPMLLLISIGLCAENSSAEVPVAVKQALTQAFPKLPSFEITQSPVDGIYEARIEGQVLYVGEKGDFFLLGELIEAKSMENLTQASQKKFRASLLSTLDIEQTVRFTPAKTKYTIYAFTDVDCVYCRKFHDNIQEIMDAGIEVRYLFAPFRGEAALARAESVWCSKDKAALMTMAKQGKEIPEKKCNNPIQEHLKLVNQLQIRGTPHIILSNGHAISGFVPPEKIIEAIQKEKIAPLS